MREDLLSPLAYPACHGELDRSIGERNGDHIEGGARYPSGAISA